MKERMNAMTAEARYQTPRTVVSDQSKNKSTAAPTTPAIAKRMMRESKKEGNSFGYAFVGVPAHANAIRFLPNGGLHTADSIRFVTGKMKRSNRRTDLGLNPRFFNRQKLSHHAKYPTKS